jgi:GNAT superfamily N-acetyltransferase
MVTVRKARSSDNEELLDIQRRSPQGTFFVLGLDSSPNYFNRTKPYVNGHVFVAEEDKQVVGSSSCAFLDTVVSGIPCKASYGYGLMVDPNHRRKGIATKLGDQVRAFIDKEGVDLRFVIIVEGNVPSINLVNKLGYSLLHDFLRVSVYMHEGQEPAQPKYIRNMKKTDAGNVAELLNEYYHGYDLYVPFTEESLLEEIDRYPFFEMDDIILYENGMGLQACLGCWNYNKITRYSVNKVPQEMIDAMTASNAPFIPKLSQTFSMYFSHYPAYRDEASIIDLVRYTNRVLREREVNYITFPVNAGTSLHNLLAEFPHVINNTHIYAMPVGDIEFPDMGKNHVYVEPAHL